MITNDTPYSSAGSIDITKPEEEWRVIRATGSRSLIIEMTSVPDQPEE